jgi:DNA-binding transcriptional LysR family regulator
MRLRDMEIFHALMRQGTTTAAAEALNISQPGVSKALKHLEGQIGIQLFVRSGGRLYPTPEAKVLYRHVRNIFARMDTVERVVSDLRGGYHGIVSVAATASIATSVLPIAAARFHKKNSGCQVIFRTLTSQQVAQRVACGEADFGLVHSPVEMAGLSVETISNVDLACIVDRSHPLAAMPSVTLHDLMDYPLISFRPGTKIGTIVRSAFEAQGLTKIVDFQTSLSATACVLASEKAGVALTDVLAMESSGFSELVTLPVEPPISLSIQLLRSEESPCSRLALRLVSELADVLGDGFGRGVDGNNESETGEINISMPVSRARE